MVITPQVNPGAAFVFSSLNNVPRRSLLVVRSWLLEKGRPGEVGPGDVDRPFCRPLAGWDYISPQALEPVNAVIAFISNTSTPYTHQTAPHFPFCRPGVDAGEVLFFYWP